MFNSSTSSKPLKKQKFDEELAKALNESKEQKKDVESSDDESSEDTSDAEHNGEGKRSTPPGRASEKRRDKATKLSKLGLGTPAQKDARHKEQMKDWRSKNPEYNRTYRQKYYAEHREEILEKRRQKRLEEKQIIEAFRAQASQSSKN